ncbi:class I SAM-dependent methyltransferase [Bacterioplanes sanyensis]|uniref:class I SAM-dependent methyltransferase n=1 Tax=Bacterioplanes sanyensis TaxID=1249553 RepID=UPI0018EE65A6|nr:class I SAM-dependent methyltransferase [Bacterioplanes sanyensis]
MQTTELTRYYAQRAQEYDRIYAKPERQSDLRWLEQRSSELCREKRILEIACGTGYWTQFLCRQATHITAIDFNQEVLDIARNRDYGDQSVQFVRDDAYTLEQVEGKFDAAFVGFWWSHVPLCRIHEFLQALHSKLQPGAKVWLLDNRYVDGSSTPISRIGTAGNSYQQRPLDDGSEYEVLKNFPTPEALRQQLAGHTDSVDVLERTYFWLAEYQLA